MTDISDDILNRATEKIAANMGNIIDWNTWLATPEPIRNAFLQQMGKLYPDNWFGFTDGEGNIKKPLGRGVEGEGEAILHPAFGQLSYDMPFNGVEKTYYGHGGPTSSFAELGLTAKPEVRADGKVVPHGKVQLLDQPGWFAPGLGLDDLAKRARAGEIINYEDFVKASRSNPIWRTFLANEADNGKDMAAVSQNPDNRNVVALRFLKPNNKERYVPYFAEDSGKFEGRVTSDTVSPSGYVVRAAPDNYPAQAIAKAVASGFLPAAGNGYDNTPLENLGGLSRNQFAVAKRLFADEMRKASLAGMPRGVNDSVDKIRRDTFVNDGYPETADLSDHKVDQIANGGLQFGKKLPLRGADGRLYELNDWSMGITSGGGMYNHNVGLAPLLDENFNVDPNGKMTGLIYDAATNLYDSYAPVNYGDDRRRYADDEQYNMSSEEAKRLAANRISSPAKSPFLQNLLKAEIAPDLLKGNGSGYTMEQLSQLLQENGKNRHQRREEEARRKQNAATIAENNAIWNGQKKVSPVVQNMVARSRSNAGSNAGGWPKLKATLAKALGFLAPDKLSLPPDTLSLPPDTLKVPGESGKSSTSDLLSKAETTASGQRFTTDGILGLPRPQHQHDNIFDIAHSIKPDLLARILPKVGDTTLQEFMKPFSTSILEDPDIHEVDHAAIRQRIHDRANGKKVPKVELFERLRNNPEITESMVGSIINPKGIAAMGIRPRNVKARIKANKGR